MTDPASILNWLRLGPRRTSSGQPNEADLAALAAIGVTDIINLALHDHPRALADEAASVAALGMTYRHIPVDFDAPGEADYQAFRAALAALDDDRVVHVHCIVNARVTAFLYRYAREEESAGEAAARAVLESVWRPGGAWARLIGDDAAVDRPHEFAGRDY